MTAAVGLVAGSGIDLSPLLDRVDESLPFAHVPTLATATIRGHEGVYFAGQHRGQPLIVQQGRLHPYEGLAIADVTQTVDVLKSLGAAAIVFTNATGGLLESLQPGEWVAPHEVRLWPYRHWPDRPNAVTSAFTLDTVKPVDAYMWVHGPCYETRAEIAALRDAGGSVVGMSTAPELVRCRELGLPAGVLSCVTNSCYDSQPLSHARVLDAAHRANQAVLEILRESLPKLFKIANGSLAI